MGSALDVDTLIQALQALSQDLHPTPAPGASQRTEECHLANVLMFQPRTSCVKSRKLLGQ